MADTPFHKVDTVFVKVTDLAAAARWYTGDPDGNRLEVCSY